MRRRDLGIGVAAGITAGAVGVAVVAALQDEPRDLRATQAVVPSAASPQRPSGGVQPKNSTSSGPSSAKADVSRVSMKHSAAYLHLGWGRPPNVKKVMKATGIRSFTLAFILSDGGCGPAWDGRRPLKGGVDARTIAAIKAAGGSVQISFGGWSGRKLGPRCATPQAYAAAVQKVIDAYRPTALDFDMENSELRNAAVQDRILRGLKIVESRNPGIGIIITMSTARKGPDRWGVRLIRRAKEFGVDVDNYTIMPFNFGGGNIRAGTVSAAQGLKRTLVSVRGWSEATAYSRMGISGMNGRSDDKEITTPATWTAIRDWAGERGLTRLAFWSVNRDRPCPGDVRSTCSGVSQNPWQFTRITAGF